MDVDPCQPYMGIQIINQAHRACSLNNSDFLKISQTYLILSIVIHLEPTPLCTSWLGSIYLCICSDHQSHLGRDKINWLVTTPHLTRFFACRVRFRTLAPYLFIYCDDNLGQNDDMYFQAMPTFAHWLRCRNRFQDDESLSWILQQLSFHSTHNSQLQYRL